MVLAGVMVTPMGAAFGVAGVICVDGGYGVARKVINPSCLIWCQASLGGSVQEEMANAAAKLERVATGEKVRL